MLSHHPFFIPCTKINIPAGIDPTSTFFSPIIPAEVKVAVPLLHAMDVGEIDTLLSVALENLNHGDSEGRGGTLASPESCSVFTALQLILRTAIQTRSKASSVERDLIAMNVPSHATDLIVETIKKHRMDLEVASVANRTRFPRLDGLHWRVDVTISSSSLLRVFRPNIVMQMELSDGRMKTFDVSIEQFHQLRYNVAKILREMQELERHPSEFSSDPLSLHLVILPRCFFPTSVMRIADEQAKKTFEE
jgi:COMM domain containing 5